MNIFYAVGVISVFIASFSQTLLKKSASKAYPNKIREYLNVLDISGYSLLGISMVLTLICYKKIGYMQSVVLEPLSYISVIFFGRLLFSEKISINKILGIILIIAGIIIFNV